MLAPVVPIRFANTLPVRRRRQLTIGVPLRLVLITIPPAMVKSEPISMIKEAYSMKVWRSNTFSVSRIMIAAGMAISRVT
jgi:hypothetical protein